MMANRSTDRPGKSVASIPQINMTTLLYPLDPTFSMKYASDFPFFSPKDFPQYFPKVSFQVLGECSLPRRREFKSLKSPFLTKYPVVKRLLMQLGAWNNLEAPILLNISKYKGVVYSSLIKTTYFLLDDIEHPMGYNLIYLMSICG